MSCSRLVHLLRSGPPNKRCVTVEPCESHRSKLRRQAREQFQTKLAEQKRSNSRDREQQEREARLADEWAPTVYARNRQVLTGLGIVQILCKLAVDKSDTDVAFNGDAPLVSP